MTVFKSPTEHHAAFKEWRTSSLPETMGADFLFSIPELGFVGIQRKEIKDLVASIRDGRLAKEIGQLEQCSMKVLIIEGKQRWTRDGESLLASGWSVTQLNGMLFSLFLKNFLVLQTEDAFHTSECVLQLKTYLMKPGSHSSLDHRPKSKGAWGKPTSREFGIHILQSFPGIGVDLAGRIYDTYGLPLRWTVDEIELAQIERIGVKKALQIIACLHG